MDVPAVEVEASAAAEEAAVVEEVAPVEEEKVCRVWPSGRVSFCHSVITIGATNITSLLPSCSTILLLLARQAALWPVLFISSFHHSDGF